MPESLLTVLKLVLLALVWLFFVRVLRAVWAEMSGRRPVAVAEPSPAGGRPRPPASVTRVPTGGPEGAVPAGGGGTARAGTGAKGELRLKIVEPAERRGRTFGLGAELTLGRAGGCGVPIPDDTFVSQLHARIFSRSGRVYVEDLGSTNGTFLNAKPVTSAVALSRGDRIQVGRTVLEVVK